jgi:hypothetical protein
MRTPTAIVALALSAITGAQVLTPPRIELDRRHPNQLTFAFCTIDWNAPGDPLRTGGALAGEFSLGEKFSLGFWAGRDEDNDAPAAPDQDWFDFHGTYFFMQKPTGVLGVSIGHLRVEIDGFDTASWGYIGLTGSSQLDANAPGGSRWTVGYNVAWLSGNESASGAFTTSDGTSYGINFDYKLSESWSLGAAYWIIDLDNGTEIHRSTLGGSFRF